MTPEDLGPDLTAFALGDPGLTPAQVAAVEARLATDPAAAQAVEETRALAATLTAALAMKAEPVGESAMARTVADAAKSKARRAVPLWAAALAACVMFGLGIGVAKRNSEFYAQIVPINVESEAGGKRSLPAEVLDRGRDATVTMGSGEAAGPVQHPETHYIPLEQVEATVVRGSSSADSEKTVKALTDGTPKPVPLAGEPKPPAPAAFGTAGGLTQPGFGGGFQRPGFDSGFQGGGFGGGQPSGGGGGPGGISGRVPSAEARKEEKGMPADAPGTGGRAYEPTGRDAYPQLVENPFVEVKGQAALSTFGVDVDTASYSIVRNHLNNNTLPPASAVRLEEMVNYFPYQDSPLERKGNDPFGVTVEMAECPWQPKHRLARIALKARPVDTAKRPPCNLVFLIDVSGSMDAPNRLPLVKAAMKLLVGQLDENDRVAIVTYAGESKLNLESTNASQKETIYRALDELRAGGSTNGGDGIQRAYATAQKHFIEKGVNRVVLCTDGDWNVGTTSTEALLELIEGKRKTCVFLSVFGFGMGNLRDEMMVKLAGKGNGNYAYIDGIAEAKKALVEQLSGTLVTVAKDVKIQIEFNPARVAHYRLLGYEKRALAAQDFHDDKKDSGEMGAGHVVTALYELVPAAAAAEPKTDGLRYQPRAEVPKPAADDKTANEAFVLKLRHKMPDKDESVLREIPVGDVAKSFDKPTDDFQFGMSVAAFALLLKDSPYKGNASYALVEELAAASLTHDPGAYRAEFLQLVKKARALSGK